MDTRIRLATAADVPVILAHIRALATFERLAHECHATEEKLRETLFGPHPAAEVILLDYREGPDWMNAGFALFFTSYSTFLAKPGLYLEDLFVKPELRSRGYGKILLAHLARLTVERGYGRLEWAVLSWNRRARDFYERLGARPMEDWTVHRLTGDELSQLAASSV